MKIFLILAAAILLCSNLHAFDEGRFLDALAQIETGGRPHVIGPSGERSVYQISRVVWVSNTTLPFDKASKPHMQKVARSIAAKHLKWIVRTLSRDGYPVTVRNCGLVWNLGYTNFKNGLFSKRAVDYVSRLNNYYIAY